MNQRSKTDSDREVLNQLLTKAQSSLYAFICSLLGGSKHAHDVLQETNLVLWEKEAEFDRSREFLPWAFKFAHLQVLAFRKKRQRDRLTFSDDLIESLAFELTSQSQSTDSRLDVLSDCIEKLAEPHRDLLRHFYGQNSTLVEISQVLGKQVGAVTMTLHRIRRALADCIDRKADMDVIK